MYKAYRPISVSPCYKGVQLVIYSYARIHQIENAILNRFNVDRLVFISSCIGCCFFAVSAVHLLSI